jgi:hypothetical protein
MGFLVDKVALGQVFSEYFHHLSSVAGTIGQLVTDVPGGLSFIPPKEDKKHNILVKFDTRYLCIGRQPNSAYGLHILLYVTT